MARTKKENGKGIANFEDDESHETNTDWISGLPDDILCSILSFLTVRDATRTSLLSRRWRHLQPHFTNLIFDLGTVYGKEASEFSTSRPKCHLQQMILRERTYQFVSMVDRFVQLHQGHKIEKFRVHFNLANEHSHNLNRWLSFAITTGVEELDLNLCRTRQEVPVDEYYNFPCQLLACRSGSYLKRLYLASCSFARPFCFKGFNSLKALALEEVNLDRGHIQDLLPNCRLLECLILRKCCGLVHFEIGSLELHLKYLEVVSCLDLKQVEIHDINLVTFEYTGPVVRFSFENVPQLARLLICTTHGDLRNGIMYALKKLPSILPQLEILFLRSMRHMKAHNIPKGSSTFPNLKKLVMIVQTSKDEYLFWVTCFLKAGPLLEKLELHLESSKLENNFTKIKCPPEHPHVNLKVVEISGFKGNQNEIEIARYILKTSTSLESMTIDPQEKSYHGNDRWKCVGASKSWTTMRRQMVYDQLCGEGPPSAQLLVL